MNVVSISLPHHRYDICVQAGVLDELGERVRGVAPHSACALLADESVFAIYGEKVRSSLAQHEYTVIANLQSSGESHKTLASVEAHYHVMLDAKLERKSPVIALGGGVLGDTAGFVAASYLRGVPLIQCPTTLLSMVDSSVGGKVGVNMPQGKNLVGSFYQPSLVLIDPEVLRSLPEREFISGLAECVKHGVLGDADLFTWTLENLPAIRALKMSVLAELVARNVEVKADVVRKDEREQGVRAHLNLGHTFGHAIEKCSGYGVYTHGEAVSLGMHAASMLAAQRGMCEGSVVERVSEALTAAGLPLTAELPEVDALMDAMMLDKKVQDGKLRLVLPTQIGEVEVVNDVPIEEVRAVWDSIRRSV